MPKTLLQNLCHLKAKEEVIGISPKDHHQMSMHPQSFTVLHHNLDKLLLSHKQIVVAKYVQFYNFYFQFPVHENIEDKMMGSCKFKWLRDRLGTASSTPYSSLMQQIKQFVLGDHDARAMEMILTRQASRAELRYAGICSLIELLNYHPILPSVRYSALCGWMSLLRPTR